MRIVISGGGSGGHVFPAIAIADALKRREPEADILFVGAKGRLEMEKVPRAGYPIKGLWISGFQRKLTLRNLTFPVKLLHSLWKANRILSAFRPQVAVGVGGYASGPILEMAVRRGIPTLIQEQNSFPGITNRLLGKRVDKVCVAYDGLERFFDANNIVKTGNPVRQDILDLSDKVEEGRTLFKIRQNKKTVLVFGGSLGARSLNNAFAANADLIERHPDVAFIWQVGKLYYERYKNHPVAALPNVRMMSFIDRMDLAYTVADIIICRAGASTIAELSLVAKAAILVPSPNVAEDHQTKNAAALVQQGAAEMLADTSVEEQMIVRCLDLLNDADRQAMLSARIRRLAIANADDRIASEIIGLIKH